MGTARGTAQGTWLSVLGRDAKGRAVHVVNRVHDDAEADRLRAQVLGMPGVESVEVTTYTDAMPRRTGRAR